MIFSATLHYSILCTGPKLLCMEMRSLKMMSMVAKTRTLTLLDQGVLQKDIAKEVNVDVQTIYKRAEGLSKGVTPERKKGSGRPRKTSLKTDNFLCRELMKNPRVTASELKKKHPKLLQDVSICTIQHRLQKDLGLPSRKAAKKPLLAKKVREKRKEFCKKYQDWSAERWHGIMFSDKAFFN